LYSAYVRACALLDSSSPMTSIRMGSIGSSGRAASSTCDVLDHERHSPPFHRGKRQATCGKPSQAPESGVAYCGPWDAAQERFVQKRTASE
jgi:hypothetical protein